MLSQCVCVVRLSVTFVHPILGGGGKLVGDIFAPYCKVSRTTQMAYSKCSQLAVSVRGRLNDIQFTCFRLSVFRCHCYDNDWLRNKSNLNYTISWQYVCAYISLKGYTKIITFSSKSVVTSCVYVIGLNINVVVVVVTTIVVQLLSI